MQKTFFDLEYNPKIDYLITKNLLYSWPRNFNEFDLRHAYKKNFGGAPGELKKIRLIRNYLRKHRLVNFTQKDFEKIVEIISDEKYNYHYVVPFKVMTVRDLDKYAAYLRSIDLYKHAYACLSMMILYTCAKEDSIVIPYRNTIKRCLDDKLTNVESIVNILKERTHRKNIKHDLKENDRARRIIKEKKQEFLKAFRNVKAYGIFGSFAMKMENEYSDIDMLVISDEDYDRFLENDIASFWHRYFDIEMDIKIVKEENIEQELTECMKKTLKMVA